MKKVLLLFAVIVSALFGQTKVNYPFDVRNGPVISVMGFGAKCDGSTDDSAAFNAAAASGALTVYVTAIAPCIVQNVRPAAGQTWTGGGTLKLKANAVATSALPVFNIAASNVSIRGLAFDLNSANTVINTTPNDFWDQPTAASCHSTGSAITGLKFSGNAIANGAYYAIDISGCQNSLVSGNTITNVVVGGLVTSANPVNGSNVNMGLTVSDNIIKNITKPGADVAGPGKGIAIAGTVGYTITGNIVQAFADGAGNDGTRETMGIEIFGANAGLAGGLVTFPLHGAISGNTVNVIWGISIAGAQDVAVTGNTVYCSGGTNASNMSFTLPGGGGCVIGVEVVSSQYVTVKGNNVSARSGAPGTGISINSSCTTCFNNSADHILIEDNQISGFVGGINVDTGLAEGGSQFTSCAINSNSAYANANGLIQAKGNEITDYRLFGMLFRSATLAEAVGNRISSAQGAYGTCGSTSGILLGPQLTQFVSRENTIAAQFVSIGDILGGGGAVTGNATEHHLSGDFLDGGVMYWSNAAGAAYYINGETYKLEPGNATAIVITANVATTPFVIENLIGFGNWTAMLSASAPLNAGVLLARGNRFPYTTTLYGGSLASAETAAEASAQLLTPAAGVVTLDCSLGASGFAFTLTGATTLQLNANCQQWAVNPIFVFAHQDNTGSRTLTFDTPFKGMTAVSPTANSTTLYTLFTQDGGGSYAQSAVNAGYTP